MGYLLTHQSIYMHSITLKKTRIMKILRIIAIVLMILFTINGIRLFLIQAQYLSSPLGYIAIFIGNFIMPIGLFFLVKFLNKKIAENENK